MASLHTHLLDIYGARLHLATDKKSWRKMRRLDPELPKDASSSAGWTMFTVFIPDDGSEPTPCLFLYVDVASHSSTESLVDTIAHEAAHAAGALLGYAGHGNGRGYVGDDEPHAYLVGWLAAWMWSLCQAHA